MQEFNVTQWAIVALVFVAGWLLGLASHPGGRKWRERYAAERDAHAGYRKDADARLAAADTRHRELEQDHARLAATPVTTAPMTTSPRSTRVVRPRDTMGERRGWFDFGPRR
ncbi:MAG: hypothetical protein JWN21_2065 [Sphingomonas bacterium]|uniref:hypothetical protein n=1 Tax=Sphingomonas bacterium TaxID=1895847 RepID=UPI0026202D31|nr:hypothetical protein [Sphingomonas bacterium]MDB5696522.1 hypothetical protein [Sphingomonas bacterium]